MSAPHAVAVNIVPMTGQARVTRWTAGGWSRSRAGGDEESCAPAAGTRVSASARVAAVRSATCRHAARDGRAPTVHREAPTAYTPGGIATGGSRLSHISYVGTASRITRVSVIRALLAIWSGAHAGDTKRIRYGTPRSTSVVPNAAT